MPADATRNTIARQWELLKLLPAHGAGKTSKELADTLKDIGYKVSKRQVERDLIVLSAAFPLDCNDASIPYGWRWMKGAAIDLPGITLAEALSARMIKDTLLPLLPSSVLEVMEPRFRQAQEKLDLLAQNNRTAQWANKVRTIPLTLQLCAPAIANGVLPAVEDALLNDEQISVLYQSIEKDKPAEFILHPIAIINSGQIPYLLATAFDYNDPRLYALHRMHEASRLPEKARRPPEFDIDRYIARSAMQFQWEPGKTIRLQADVSPWLARILEETPLSSDQTVKHHEEGAIVTATVPDSWQLHWWILSQGSSIRVQKPKALQRSIAQQLREAAALYDEDQGA